MRLPYEDKTHEVEQATKEYLEWIAQDDNPGGQPPADGSWLWPLPGYRRAAVMAGAP